MANTKKRWTADEIEILRKYYPAEGDQVCERLSGRTAKSCRIQASKMEISKNISSSATVQNDVKYVRLWTEAEDKILREYYAAEGSKVRYRLNQRSAESCRGRADISCPPLCLYFPGKPGWLTPSVPAASKHPKIFKSSPYRFSILSAPASRRLVRIGCPHRQCYPIV